MADPNSTSINNTKKEPMIRLDIYVKKHPSLTTEEFHERWSKGHAPLISGWLAEKGIHRYTQYHAPPHLTSLSPGVYQDAQTLEFDGHAEIVVSNIETLRKLVDDKFLEEIATPDSDKLIDLPSTKRSIGYEEQHVWEGKAV